MWACRKTTICQFSEFTERCTVENKENLPFYEYVYRRCRENEFSTFGNPREKRNMIFSIFRTQRVKKMKFFNFASRREKRKNDFRRFRGRRYDEKEQNYILWSFSTMPENQFCQSHVPRDMPQKTCEREKGGRRVDERKKFFRVARRTREKVRNEGASKRE